jgi:thioredoxin-related protein
LRRTFLLAAAAIALAAPAFAGGWLTNTDAAQKKAKQNHQLIFVDLFAEWCGWCHRFEAEVVPSQAFQQATDDMILLRLNTEDGKDGTKIARDYSIMSLPTFVVLNEDLVVAGLIRGYSPPTEFAGAMKEVKTKYSAFLKRAGNEASYAKDYQKRLDLAKEYRSRYGLSQSETRLRKLLDEPALPDGIRDEAYYELAVSQFFARKYDDAQKTLKKFSTVQTKGDLFERSRLLVGDIYVQQGNFLSAANEYRNFKTSFPKSQYVRNVEMVLPQVERQLAGRK